MVDREQVVQATREILLTRGIRGVTTDAVVRRARISKKTLYKLFSSKEELLEATFLSLLEESLAQVDAVLDSQLPPLAKLARLFAELETLLSRVQPQFLEQVRHFHPGIWRRLEAERGKRLEKVAELIRRCQVEGTVRADLDVGLWLLLLKEAVEGVIRPETLLQEGISSGRALRAIRQVFFEGLLTEKSKRGLASQDKRGGTI